MASKLYRVTHEGAGEKVFVAFDRDGDERRASIATASGQMRTLRDVAADCDGLAEAVVLALVLHADGEEKEEKAEPEHAITPTTPKPEVRATLPTAVDRVDRLDGKPSLKASPFLRMAAGATSEIAAIRDVAFGAQIAAHLGPKGGFWSVGAIGVWLPQTSIDVGAGVANVSYVGAGVEACLRRSLGVLQGEACARGEGGSLIGHANGFAANESHARPLFAAGLTARGLIAIGGPLSLYLEGSLRVPIHRERFAIEGIGTVYDPPAIGAGAGGGAAVSFQ